MLRTAVVFCPRNSAPTSSSWILFGLKSACPNHSVPMPSSNYFQSNIRRPAVALGKSRKELIMENWVDYVKDLEEGCKQPPNFYNLTYFLSVLSYTQHDLSLACSQTFSRARYTGSREKVWLQANLSQRLDICNWSARDTGWRFPSSP